MLNRSCGCRGEFTVGAKQVRSETPSMRGIERKRGRIPVLLAKQK